MNKNNLKRALSAVAVSALALSASSVSAFAALTDHGMDYDCEPADGSAAESKPVVSVTKTKAQPGEVVTVEIAVGGENVDSNYSTTGFHVYWDDALTVQPQKNGKYAKAGEALEDINVEQKDNGASGVFLASMGSEDLGYEGVMWTINLKVPDDAVAGTVYPIDICYQTDSSKNDLFAKHTDSDQGKLMQAWFFTKGINSTQYNPNTDPVLADYKFAEGYIQVDGAVTEPTTTSTTQITTTTAAPTTTTTAASTTTTVSSAVSTTTTVAESSTAADSTSTTKAQSTTTKKGSGKSSDSPKTGVTGVGVAVAGLAVAVGTAFALKKKED